MSNSPDTSKAGTGEPEDMAMPMARVSSEQQGPDKTGASDGVLEAAEALSSPPATVVASKTPAETGDREHLGTSEEPTCEEGTACTSPELMADQENADEGTATIEAEADESASELETEDTR